MSDEVNILASMLTSQNTNLEVCTSSRFGNGAVLQLAEIISDSLEIVAWTRNVWISHRNIQIQHILHLVCHKILNNGQSIFQKNYSYTLFWKLSEKLILNKKQTTSKQIHFIANINIYFSLLQVRSIKSQDRTNSNIISWCTRCVWFLDYKRCYWFKRILLTYISIIAYVITRFFFFGNTN